MCPHFDLVGHLTGETSDVVGGPRHALPGIGGLPGGAVVVGLLPPAHPVPRAVGVGADECRGRPIQCHRADAGGRHQVAHQRRRPGERDGVGGGRGTDSGGYYHCNRLGGPRRQRQRRGWRAARGSHAVHRHRGTRVGSNGGHLHPGHIQRSACPVLESRHIIVLGISQVGSGGHHGAVGFYHRGQLDRDRGVALVDQRQRVQGGIGGYRRGLHLGLHAV